MSGFRSDTASPARNKFTVCPSLAAVRATRKASAALVGSSGPVVTGTRKDASALHPVFIEGSSDRTRRTGVGVSGPGMVHFAISERQVNFHDFARFFRDFLGCRNALFLDGGRGTGL